MKSMDISYYKQYEPFFGAWKIEREIGRGSYGHVFEIVREEYGETYRSALKVITIPVSKDELRSQLRKDNMDYDKARTYYKGMVEDFIKEVSIMSRLEGNTNIVSYQDHQVIEHKDDIGWDILIRMELATPLDEYMMVRKLKENDIVRLGIDICKALELCETQGIIHRDIKPDNIFVSKIGDFKLGDFGVSKMIAKTVSAKSVAGAPGYMAPEVSAGIYEYDKRADIYSLGITMYELLNGNHLPFISPYLKDITYSEAKEALNKQYAGEKIPSLRGVNKELDKIVLKACSFKAKDRFSSAKEMRKALEAIGESKKKAKISTANRVLLILASVLLIVGVVVYRYYNGNSSSSSSTSSSEFKPPEPEPDTDEFIEPAVEEATAEQEPEAEEVTEPVAEEVEEEAEPVFSDDFTAGEFILDGDFYQMPVTAQDFIDNGWEIFRIGNSIYFEETDDEDKQDKVWLELTQGDESFLMKVKNSEDEEVLKKRNPLLMSFNNVDELNVAENVGLGMSKEEFDAYIDSGSYEKDSEEKGYYMNTLNEQISGNGYYIDLMASDDKNMDWLMYFLEGETYTVEEASGYKKLTQGVNARSGPNADDFDSVEEVYQKMGSVDTVVTVTGVVREYKGREWEWFRVITPSGVEAFINGKYLEDVQLPQTFPSTYDYLTKIFNN